MMTTQLNQHNITNQQTIPKPPQKVLTKEQIVKLHKLLEKMRSEGKDSDPQYLKLLQLFKQQYEWLKYTSKLQKTGMMQQQMQQPGKPTQSVYFSKSQHEQLKAQILAFKNHITKNVPMPPCLIKAVQGVNTHTNLQEYNSLYSAALNQTQFTPPLNVVPLQNKSSFPQMFPTMTTQLGQIPQKPNGLDLNTLYHEREKRIQSKMQKRFLELKKILQNAPQHEKVKAVIEMKGLQLLALQKKVRNEILQEAIALQQGHKRKGRSGRRKRIELEIDSKIRGGRRKFLHDLGIHRKHFKEFFKDKSKTIDKLNKELLSFFEKKAKLEREKKEKEERARLKALKENDSEAYFKLLENAKNDRLMELLKQTDECLRKLGAQLVSERDGETEENEEETEENETVYAKYLKNERKYYTVAHKFTEVIDRQPSSLVGGQLKEYQLKGLQWLVSLYNNKLNGILADEMGLGKTIQTISLLCYIMEYKNNKGPHLVIVPLSTMENWYLEFQKWAPHINVVKYTGNQQKRKELQQTKIKERKFNVLLTQYEFITRDRKILKKIPWNYIIIDEGHRIKNANCKLVLDLNQYKSKHRLLLTGTPLQNDLKELWALLHFLLPRIFDNSVNFEGWFNQPFANISSDKLQMSEEETLLIIHRLHQVLRPFLLRREKKDVEGQLPEKVEKIIRCSLSAMQKKFYEQIKDKNRLLLDKEGKFKLKSLNNSVMQLRKVCNHPFLFLPDWMNNFNETDLIRVSGKFELLDRILPKLQKTGHRVLLFSQMTQLLDILEVYLKYRRYQYLRLDGNVKADLRGRLVKDFNAPNSPYFLFLLSTRSGGLGLNLQSADTVIIFDSDWNPQQDLQAQARAHRIGQTKEVRVFVLLTATGVEEKIRERAQEKRDAEAKVIQAGLFNQKSTYKERQDMLNAILYRSGEDYQYDVPDDDELNKIIARNDEEYEIFTKMDEERERRLDEYWGKLGMKKPARLMTEEELPDWLKHSEEELDKLTSEILENYGRGRRRRKKINYDDSLSDDLFSDEEVMDGGKRPRRQAKKTTKREYPEKEMVEEPEKKRPKRILVTETQKTLHGIYKKLVELRDDSGRWIPALFMELPSQELYPDYYQLIKFPICFNMIEDAIYGNPYYTLSDFEKDIRTMVTNAQTYNEEGSQVHTDSKIILNAFLTEKRKLEEGQVEEDKKEEDKKEEEEKEENEKEEDEKVEEDTNMNAIDSEETEESETEEEKEEDKEEVPDFESFGQMEDAFDTSMSTW